MYRLPQAGRISHDAVVKNLDSYGYQPSIKPPGLWTHKNLPTNFTLLVNYFRVIYSGKEYALHLKAALEDK